MQARVVLEDGGKHFPLRLKSQTCTYRDYHQVEHACKVHSDAPDLSAPLGLRLLTADEHAILAAKSYTKRAFPRYSAYRIKHDVPDCFECNYCSYRVSDLPRKSRKKRWKNLTLAEILQHLQEK